MQVEHGIEKKGVYERVGMWLDLNPKYVNLIRWNSPQARKNQFISPEEMISNEYNLYMKLRVKWIHSFQLNTNDINHQMDEKQSSKMKLEGKKMIINFFGTFYGWFFHD
jgi:hypothetical protein